MFNFIKNSLSKLYHVTTKQISGLLGTAKVNSETLKELQRLLLEADVGTTATKQIMDTLQAEFVNGQLQSGWQLKQILQKQLSKQLTVSKPELGEIILLVGVNGSGKTTLAAKLAHYFQNQNERVLVAAADTFRAAATEQLIEWSERLNFELHRGEPNQDPAAVVFQACSKFQSCEYERLIIDTAGRLQTKTHLMQELAKIRRVISKSLPDKSVSTLLTIDTMLGQNSLVQAQEFHQIAKLDGLVLTKMDGSGKGGIALACTQQLQIPVYFVAHGESSADLKPFEASSYVSAILED